MPEWLPTGTIAGLCAAIVVLARTIYLIQEARIADAKESTRQVIEALNTNTKATDDLTEAILDAARTHTKDKP